MSKALENMSFDELIEVNKELESQKIAYESQLKSYESKLSQMQFQIDQFKRLMYGAKRERFIPNQDENQMTLPFEVEQETEVEKQ